MRYFALLSLAITLCFGFQTMVLHAVGGLTVKSESNFFSSVSRLQNGEASKVKVALLGSSRTGRFPDHRSLPEQFPQVANMGCDGASAAILLRAIERGHLSKKPILVIEGNTLQHDLVGRGHDVENYIGTRWFQLGIAVRMLRADARPSAILYSHFLKKKIGGFAVEDGTKPLLASHKARVSVLAPNLTENVQNEVERLAKIIRKFRDEGIQVLIVIIPPPSDNNSLSIQIPKALSHLTNTPLLDLSVRSSESLVTYTDCIHMAPKSAAVALRSILLALEEL